MKVIDSIWFTTFSGSIGIVLGEDAVTGQKKAYIDSVKGIDREHDIKKICEHGAKFPADIAEQLF